MDADSGRSHWPESLSKDRVVCARTIAGWATDIARLGVLIVLLPASVDASASSPRLFDRMSAAELSSDDLYIELVSAYKPLSDCLRPLITSGRVSTEIAVKVLAASPGLSAFRHDAIKILGDSDPAVLAADRANATAEQARLLMQGLGNKAAVNDPAFRLTNARAIVLAMMQLARVSDGQCVPSPNLQYWKRRSDAADHQDPRPRNP